MPRGNRIRITLAPEEESNTDGVGERRKDRTAHGTESEGNTPDREGLSVSGDQRKGWYE